MTDFTLYDLLQTISDSQFVDLYDIAGNFIYHKITVEDLLEEIDSSVLGDATVMEVGVERNIIQISIGITYYKEV